MFSGTEGRPVAGEDRAARPWQPGRESPFCLHINKNFQLSPGGDDMAQRGGMPAAAALRPRNALNPLLPPSWVAPTSSSTPTPNHTHPPHTHTCECAHTWLEDFGTQTSSLCLRSLGDLCSQQLLSSLKGGEIPKDM